MVMEGIAHDSMKEGREVVKGMRWLKRCVRMSLIRNMSVRGYRVFNEGTYENPNSLSAK